MDVMLEELRARDVRHLWHPYTDAATFEKEPYICIERAEGVYLYEAGGRPLLDGIASWWAMALGHGHPRLLEALHKQADTLQHSILGNMSHPMAVELAYELAQIAPGDLNHVYFACDGSSATEAALKMAVQYWAHRGEAGRVRFAGLEEGYHGDTLGAMGAGFTSWFQGPFGKLVVPAYQAKSPHCPCCAYDKTEGHCALEAFTSMEALVRDHHKELAAVILEPLCQGAGGIRIYPAEYLRRVRALCDEYHVLLIADEIAVGFARTGSLWACEKAGIVPDILCTGKALTGGHMPMSAAIASDEIYDAFRGDGVAKRPFWDGHTYCGNPIASAVALAALAVYAEEDFVRNGAPLRAQLKAGMEAIGALPGVAYQKSLGLIGMCAFTGEAGGAAFARRVSLKALELGLFIRPLGGVLYLWPPLTTTREELAQMLHCFQEAIATTQ